MRARTGVAVVQGHYKVWQATKKKKKKPLVHCYADLVPFQGTLESRADRNREKDREIQGEKGSRDCIALHEQHAAVYFD